MSTFVELARFHHAEPLHACTKVLDAAGISYRLSNDSLTSNVSMTMVAYNATCIVTVREEDVAAARQALLDEARKEVAAGVPDDHYFIELTNEGLFDVIGKPLEWSPYDLAVAEKLLLGRGATMDLLSVLEAAPPPLANSNPDQPLPGKRRVALVYLVTGFVLGPLLAGMFMGLNLVLSAEPSPVPGRRQFVYDEHSRQTGMVMFAFSIVVTGALISLLRFRWP